MTKTKITINNNGSLNIKDNDEQDSGINSLESELLLLFPINNMNDSVSKKALDYYNIGTELFDVNKYEAIKMYTKALEIKPDLLIAYYQRANIYSLIDEYDLAIKDYTTLIKHNDKISNAYYYRGNCLMYIDEYESAIKDYAIALLLNPKFAKAYLYGGNTKTYLKDDEGAIADLKKCIELTPDNADAHYNLGLLFLRNEDFGKAIFNYTKAIRLNPSDYRYYEERAYAYIFQKSLKKACADLNTASTLGLDITKNGLNLLCNQQ